MFLLTEFKEERANLQYDRQSGAMFEDEERSLCINLRGSRFPARSVPAASDLPWPGWALGILFKSLQTTSFFAKQKTESLCLVLSFLVFYIEE